MTRTLVGTPDPEPERRYNLGGILSGLTVATNTTNAPIVLRRGPVYDQGPEPSSVGHAAAAMLQGPRLLITEADEATEMYHRAQEVDPWPDE